MPRPAEVERRRIQEYQFSLTGGGANFHNFPKIILVSPLCVYRNMGFRECASPSVRTGLLSIDKENNTDYTWELKILKSTKKVGIL